jgi:hypothetical protein
VAAPGLISTLIATVALAVSLVPAVGLVMVGRIAPPALASLVTTPLVGLALFVFLALLVELCGLFPHPVNLERKNQWHSSFFESHQFVELTPHNVDVHTDLLG